MNDDINKIIEFIKNYEVMFKQKTDDKLSFICLLSNEHCNYYYLDISRYFATLLYHVTGNSYYLTCDKKTYIQLGATCNKIYPITTQLRLFACDVLKSFSNKFKLSFLYQDTIDSGIVEGKNEIFDESIVEYSYSYLGILFSFKIKVKHVQLYYRNRFSNMFVMIANNQVASNLKIKLPDASTLIDLVVNKEKTINDLQLANVIAQIRIATSNNV